MNAGTVPVTETWDLTKIYADADAFHADMRRLAKHVEGLDSWTGKLGESSTNLGDALEAVTVAAKKFYALRCYSALQSDLDTRIAEHQSMRQETELLATDFSGKTSYLRPEILALGPDKVEALIREDPRLEVHAHYLRDLMRQREHVLTPAEEKIMASTGLITRDAHNLYELLHNAEMPRGSVTLHDGTEVKLTPVNHMRHRVTRHREDRRAVSHGYFASYAAMRGTLGQNLFAATKGHWFSARNRNYESCMAAALDAENIPTTVYTNLVAQVNEKLPLLHRYIGLRCRALGIDQPEYCDLYPPLIEEQASKYSPDDAMALVSEGVKPLGEEYVKELDGGFRDRWVDWHPGEGKRAGAYATGWAYDLHPFVMMNFCGDFDGVTTLAHEMGHAMHSFFSNREQPFATSDYSIFVAEVASTLNEALLAESMYRKATDPMEKLSLLGRQLDGLRATLFRQTMFAEFELETHTRTERGEVLTGETLDALYLELLRRHHDHGHTMHVDDVYAVEWAAIPHFYSAFYVYQYSTGIVAAHALAEALLSGEEGARERILEFLSAGGSDYPLNVLRRAGVDLETREPYDAAMKGMERNLDELEALLDSGVISVADDA